MRKFFIGSSAVFIGLFLCLMLASAVGARVIRVSPQGNDSLDGSTWEKATKTIRAGIAKAVAGDEVWVAAGVYGEHVTLRPGVALYGGFAGAETQREQRNWQSHSSVIEAPENKAAEWPHSSPGPASAVFIPTAATPDTRLDGFVVKNLGSPASGGGVYCAGSATIANNVITGCYVSGNGGGIYCTGERSPVITNNIIRRNEAGTGGGGIYCSEASAVIRDNAIFGNRCGGSGVALGGGGIFCYGETVVVNNQVTGNESVNYGGGICVLGGKVVVAGNVIADNAVQEATYSSGGGIYCSGTGSSMITNNTIVRNKSEKPGGGIFFAKGCLPVIANNILTLNSTGIATDGGSTALANNCIYGQEGENYVGVLPGDGDLVADPGFVDGLHGDFRLKSGSACVNAGADDMVQPDVADMDGAARVYGSHVDIGAYELSGEPVASQKILRVDAKAAPGGDGKTWATAFNTIQAAADYAAAEMGCEIWVAEGTYTESVTLAPFTRIYGGFAGSETTIGQRDWKRHRSVIGGTSPETSINCAGSTTVDGLMIKSGLEIRHGHSRVTNCVVIGMWGIEIARGDAEIVDNRICGNGGYGISLYLAHVKVSRNTILGCEIGVGGNYSGMVSNNVIAECRTGVDGSWGPISIINNTIVGSTNQGVYIHNADGVVKNNIIADCGTGIERYGEPDGTFVISNNNVHNNDTDYATGTSPGANDVDTYPDFVSRELGDFHIQPYPWCLGKGDASAVEAGELDIDGNPRVVDGKVDIGAHQCDGTFREALRRVIRVNAQAKAGGDGSSWEKAYRTLADAMDDAMANGAAEVWVAAGTYKENVWVAPFTYVYGGFDGTEMMSAVRNWIANPVIVEGDGIESYDQFGPRGVMSCCGTCLIDGFTLKNALAGVIVQNGPATISNNTITGNGHGILAFGGPVSVASNTITQNNGSGIVRSGSPISARTDDRVVGNYVTKNGSTGILFAYTSGTISSNVIAENGGVGVTCRRSSLGLVGNTVVGNKTGFYCHESSDSLVANNIIAFNTTVGVEVRSGTMMLYNDVFGNPTDYLGLPRDSADISADPLFRDRANGDYHLTAKSPCINKGWPVPGTGILDIDGGARIFGGRVDIGADESGDAPMSIVAAKTMWSSNKYINGSGMAVSAVFPDYFYIESDDRASGIMVKKPGHRLSAGMRVDLDGNVDVTPDGEVCVVASSASPAGSGVVLPMFMSGSSLGGGTFGLQDAVWSWRRVKIEGDGIQKQWLPAASLSNIGLLIRFAGRVTRISTDGYYYVDDGSILEDGTKTDGASNIGVRVAGDGSAYSVGDTVVVTGVSSCFRGEDDKLRRLIRPVEVICPTSAR